MFIQHVCLTWCVTRCVSQCEYDDDIVRVHGTTSYKYEYEVPRTYICTISHGIICTSTSIERASLHGASYQLVHMYYVHMYMYEVL